MKASLYLHIPFCHGACDYCDFYSVSSCFSQEILDRYILLLLGEVSEKLERFDINTVPTLFVGGGTPSILGPHRLLRLFSGLRELLPAWPGEVTIEANPESVDADTIQALHDAGFGPNDRLSLGIQSLDLRSREAVGRIGSVDDALRVLDLSQRLFPGRVSADLIAGLPHQSRISLNSDIERILSFGLSHVSLYSLTLEPGTPLFARTEHDSSFIPNGDESDQLWIEGRDLLEQRGIHQYEVSNFSRENAECRHNLRYWNMESWVGAGPAASGTLVEERSGTARRCTCKADVESYLTGKCEEEIEEIDRNTLMAESLMMGFRLRTGPDCGLFNSRFGCRIEDRIGTTIGKWRGRGLLELDHLALTREGLLLLDPFLVEALSELAVGGGLMQPPDNQPIMEESRR